MTEFFTQSFNTLKSRCQPGLWFSSEVSLLSSQIVGGIHFLAVARLRSPFPAGFLLGITLSFYRLPAVPCHVAHGQFTTWMFAFFQATWSVDFLLCNEPEKVLCS